jgi:hypothetical protein
MKLLFIFDVLCTYNIRKSKINILELKEMEKTMVLMIGVPNVQTGKSMLATSFSG